MSKPTPGLLTEEQLHRAFDRDDWAALWQHIEAQAAQVQALETALDTSFAACGVLGNMLRYIAFVTTGDENGDAQLGADRMKGHVAELEAEVERLTKENHGLRLSMEEWKDASGDAQDEAIRLTEEKRGQLQMLTEIRRLADEATGIDRSRGDEREPGALGAVKRLTEALQTARAERDELKGRIANALL
jgi:hypothetical protein